jgi:peptide/nickel transport system substrate-binding protein
MSLQEKVERMIAELNTRLRAACDEDLHRQIAGRPGTVAEQHALERPLLRALPDLGYVSAKHIYEGTDIRQNPANTAPVGTGPFRFVQYERGQFIIADRNPNYWRNNMPYLDRVVWRVVSDRSAAAAQMESGQLLFSPFSALSIADFTRLGRDPRFEVTTRGNEGNARTNTLEFNFRNPILADIRVRRAIAHALDIPFFIENFLGPFAKVGTGPIPTTSPDFYPPNMPQYPFNRAQANRLLDEAGHRRGAGGVLFNLRLNPAPWGEDIALWSTFIQQSLNEVGIRVEIVRLDAAGFLRTVYNDWNFDLATGWHQYRNDPAVSTTVWYRSGQPRGAPWTSSPSTCAASSSVRTGSRVSAALAPFCLDSLKPSAPRTSGVCR